MIGFRHSERGQALIILVLTFVGLLAAVGLAVDGGMVLLERRRMQNAADAGALAGTRELAAHLCDDNPDEAATDAAIWNVVLRYAERNGVPDAASNVIADYVAYDLDLGDLAVTGPVGSGEIATGSAGISTTVRIERPTSFMTVLGLHTGSASAHAAAVTAPAEQPPVEDSGELPASSGMGLLPVGLLYDTLLGPGGNPVEVGDQRCIIDSEDWGDCVDEDTGKVDIVDCLKERNLPSANRGWLMLSCVFNNGVSPGDGVGSRIPDCSAGSDELKGWINQSDPFADPIYPGPVGSKAGDWIRGDPGKRQAAFAELEELGVTRPEETFFVPVFDRIWLGERMEDKFAEPDNVFTTNSYWYHIVGFVGVKVDPPERQSPDCSSGSISIAFPGVVHHAAPPDFTDGWGWEEAGTCETLDLAITLHD